MWQNKTTKMMNKILIAFFAIFAALALADHVEMCSGPDSTAKVYNLTVDPFPPFINEPFLIYVEGELTKEVSDATADVEVRYGIIPVIDLTIDYCRRFPGAECPIAPYSFVFNQMVTIPGITPPGRYRIDVQAWDQDNDEIFCVTIDADVRRPKATISN